MPKMKEPLPVSFDITGGLITYEKMIDGERITCCVGYLLPIEGRLYDAVFGRMQDLTEEQAKAHNEAFSRAEIEGLDNNCDVGMGGSFYLRHTEDAGVKRYRVQTFLGTLVSDDVTVKGRVVTFRRNDMTFRGHTTKDADLFAFKRIS